MNAGSSFQRLIDEVLHGLPFAYCYLDDIFYFSGAPGEPPVGVEPAARGLAFP